METDRHYFFEGLFIIGLGVATAVFFVWLENSGHRDDVVYRIHFQESVSGLSPGDAVKFQGVDVGTVKTMQIDKNDPRLVQVDVSLRKDTPVRTDTRATLAMKGLTGVETIELTGGSANSQDLLAATPAGEVPEIRAEKSKIAQVLEELPLLVHKFSAIEDQAKKVVSDIGGVTNKIKENPTVLLFKPKDKDKDKPR
jgi:phospholipid/cholesterol/gamma-HCH transport system substrate-binding protein